MSKYIDVKIYGECGSRIRCPKRGDYSCKPQLLRKSKFYLAFENSNCREYITEKTMLTSLR